MERKGLIVRESVPRDARLKKIVLTDKSRDIAEALRTSAIAMEGILLQGLSDDEIREFMKNMDFEGLDKGELPLSERNSADSRPPVSFE